MKGKAYKRTQSNGKAYVQKIYRREKQDESVTQVPDVSGKKKTIICKMKVPLLILCLSVFCGICTTYAYEKSLNFIKDITGDDGNYLSDYSNALLKKSLSRHKRTNLLSPFTNIALHVMKANPLFNTASELFNYIHDVLEGRTLCPKIEELSFDSILRSLHANPIKTMKDLICYALNAIGAQNYALVSKIMDLTIQFVITIVLPVMHTILNMLKDTGLLPSSFVALIDMFNVFYKLQALLHHL